MLLAEKNIDGNALYVELTTIQNVDLAFHPLKKIRFTSAGFAAQRFYLKNKICLSTV